MKIMIVLFNNFLEKIGGAERGFANMANAFVRRGHLVTGVYNRIVTEPFVFPLDKRVKLYNVNTTGKKIKGSFLKKIVRETCKSLVNKGMVKDYYELEVEKKIAVPFQKIIDKERPDFIIFYNEDGYAILKYLDIGKAKACLKLNTGEASINNLTSPRHKDIFSGLEKLSFIHVYLPYQKELLAARIPEMKIVVIPNEVKLASVNEQPRLPWIVMTSRMVRVKRPDLLIKAFRIAAAEVQGWELHLYGKFEEKAYKLELETLIASYNLQEKVFLEGPVTAVEKVLSKSGIFVFTSSVEGFGRSLAEAMQQGLPCVAAQDCPAAVCLLGAGKSGFLCNPDPAAFAAVLVKLMRDQNLRQKWGTLAQEAGRKYDPENIFTQWLEVISASVASEPGFK